MWYDQSMSIWTLSLKSMLPFNRNFLISDVWVTFSNEVFGKYFKKTLNATVVYTLYIRHLADYNHIKGTLMQIWKSCYMFVLI